MSLLQQDEDIVCRYSRLGRCYNKIRISFVVVTTRSGYRLSLLQQDGHRIVCRCYNKIRISFVVVTTRSVDIVCRCYNKIRISFVVVTTRSVYRFRCSLWISFVTTRSGYRLSLLQQDEDIVCRCYNKMRISFVVVTTR